MDSKTIREQTREQVAILGYAFNPNLPLLDPIEMTKTSVDLLDRTLVLNACVAVSFGFASEAALAWLDREGLAEHVTVAESEFLQGQANAKRTAFQWQVESLWGLVWAGGFFPTLDFGQTCSNSMVKMFPDLKAGEASNEFRQACVMRSVDEITPMLDLAYCLHWAIREQELQGVHSLRNDTRIPGQAIIERRRALEWLTGDEGWEDVSLDT